MNTVLFGDCRESMRKLIADGVKVQMCVTSPPYYGLRDYGVEGQIGQEPDPDQYIAVMVETFGLVRDLLADDGTLWLNIGDSYSGGGRGNYDTKSNNKGNSASRGLGRPNPEGYKPKDLIGVPWTLALALRKAGWYLRQDIIWHKPNPMPESVTDRCTRAHEYLFLLAKSDKYYYDADAIKEPLVRPEEGKRKKPAKFGGADKHLESGKQSRLHSGNEYVGTSDGKRNKRSVWTVTPKPYKGAHFATFPPDLIEPCILAGTSELGHCPLCFARPTRKFEKTLEIDLSAKGSRFDQGKTGDRTGGDRTQEGERYLKVQTGWETCSCGTSFAPDVVFDPFMGSGTTAQVALQLGRQYLGCELNPEYKALQDERIAKVSSLSEPVPCEFD